MSREFERASSWSTDSLWIIVLVFVAAFLQSQWRWVEISRGTPDSIINGDGRGYYEYLPAIFLRHNLHDLEPNNGYILEHGDRAAIKYYSGTAILMSPFFFAACTTTAISDLPLVGHGPWFQWFMGISALFYMAIGLKFLSRLLSTYDLNRFTILLVLTMVLMATNLLYYVTEDPTASHVYSFAIIAAFAFFVRSFASNPSHRKLLAIAVTLALVVLIRPVNGMVLAAIPFLVGTREKWLEIKGYLLASKGWIMASMILFGALVFLHPILTFIQTGSWFLWTYNDEGFYFHKPQWFKFLFSFKGGVFVYTPIIILSFIGAVRGLIEGKRFWFLSYSIFFLCVVYVLSSWWNWHYGGSFGSRPLIDFYGIFFIPAAIWLDSLRSSIRNSAFAFAAACLFLNVFQTAQAQRMILSTWHMNSEKYAYQFGKWGDRYVNILGGRDDAKPYHHRQKVVYEGVFTGEPLMHWRSTPGSKMNGQTVIAYQKDTEFNVEFVYQFSRDFSYDQVFVEMSLDRFEKSPDACTEAYVVFELRNPTGKTLNYYAFRINDVPAKASLMWHTWHYNLSLGEISPNDRLVAYVWNKGGGIFDVDNIRLRLLGLN